MAASLGGLDAIAFTGGIGERSAPARGLATEGLGFLGIELDVAANTGGGGAIDTDRAIGAPGASVAAFVVPAREDVEIARACARPSASDQPSVVAVRAVRPYRPARYGGTMNR